MKIIPIKKNTSALVYFIDGVKTEEDDISLSNFIKGLYADKNNKEVKYRIMYTGAQVATAKIEVRLK
jgi:hypothetical protein